VTPNVASWRYTDYTVDLQPSSAGRAAFGGRSASGERKLRHHAVASARPAGDEDLCRLSAVLKDKID